MTFRRFALYAILLIFIVLLFVLIPRTAPWKAGLSRFNPVSISFAYCSNSEDVEKLTNEMVERFNKSVGKDVGIVVEARNYKSVDYYSSLVSDFLVGGITNADISDINMVNYETAYLAKTMNKIASIDDYLEEEELSEYIRGYLERGRYTSDSKRFVFPINNDTKVIYVNNVQWERFKQANPGYDESVFETWESLVEVSMRYYDWTDSLTPDIEGDGKAFIAFDSLSDYIFTSSNQLMNSIIQPGHKEVRINLDKRALYRLWEPVYKGFIYGGISIQRRENKSELMTSGDIVCYIASTKNVDEFPLAFMFMNKVGETKLRVYDFPTFNNQRKVSPMEGDGLIVLKSDSKKEFACFYFLDWLVTQDEYVQICYDEMVMPVKHDSHYSEYAITLVENGQKAKEAMKKHRAIVFEAASQQVLEGEPYAPVAFSKSSKFMQEVEDSFYDNVFAGIMEVDRLTEKGYDRRDSVEQVASNELFEIWYQSLKSIAEKY
ncbi:MAG: extracellular solute-binding protein [Clostridiaceae bacterium]|nr:extracellular solute-binding protein [Clostridiaceae bacterium]